MPRKEYREIPSREKGRGRQAVDARGLALEALTRIMEKGEFCDRVVHELLEDHSAWDRRDRSFFTRLVQGTVERCIEIDHMIGQYSDMPVAKMKPAVREILRLSVYQIMYMDQVPDSAACNEGVKLAQACRLVPLKGFVNGVLRSVARFHEDTPYPKRKSNLVYHLSVWYSMPEWIVERFLRQYGEQETERILRSFLQEERDTTVRCNLSQAGREEIVQSLKEQGVEVKPGRLFEDALHIRHYDRLDRLEAFTRGWIQVQDESSMIVGRLAPVSVESTVLDVCAAPGGKSLHLADKMKGEGLILACDIAKDKLTLIRQNLIRTGIHNVKLKKQDATSLREEWVGKADVVIADLPCSGLGVIGHKADIKYKTKESDITVLARQQRRILQTVHRYVRPEGILMYSTCTMTPEENEEQVSWIQEHLPFRACSIEDQLPEVLKGKTGEQGYIQILPTYAGGDGFFLAVFRSVEEPCMPERDEELLSNKC